jgi:hypothetical protein
VNSNIGQYLIHDHSYLPVKTLLPRMTDCRLVSSFPFASSVISALVSSGFRVVDDFHGLEPLDVQDETNLSIDDSLAVWKYIQTLSQVPASNTAAAATATAAAATSPAMITSSSSSSSKSLTTFKDMIDKSKNEIPIITFCRAIDELFGLKKQAGVPIGQIVSQSLLIHLSFYVYLIIFASVDGVLWSSWYWKG